jgi:hypothetical protein
MPPLADAPVPDPRWSSRGGPSAPAGPRWQRTPPRLPPGFRWIAVRPGAAPQVRRGRRPLGPTPRYAVIPRWGLADRVEHAPAATEAPPTTGPSAAAVRATLFVTELVLAFAALVYVGRYVLLVINRTTLLNWLLAGAVDWFGVVISLAAMAATLTAVIVLIRWLIARRAAALSHQGLPEHRSARQLWTGCLVPLANLLWAPVYVIELAITENHYARLKRPIVVWWIAWICSYGVSIFAIVTSWATDAQGIANNTTAMVFAYLFAATSVAAVARVFEGFERKPVERPAHRWLVVPPDGPARPAAPASAGQVELQGQEPAA